MSDYHLVYITDDCDNPLFGDMAVHEGLEEVCERCE